MFFFLIFLFNDNVGRVVSHTLHQSASALSVLCVNENHGCKLTAVELSTPPRTLFVKIDLLC